jgi:glutamate-5-semialdehyde dehydrogenase
MEELDNKGKLARVASRLLEKASIDSKNHALMEAASLLLEKRAVILKANNLDIQSAKNSGIKGAFLERLELSDNKIEIMAEGLKSLALLEDPIGEVTWMKKRPNGLMIGQKRVPLGVIGIIYESRPNVTVDVFGLCLKTSNAVILRGGKEAIESNKAIVSVLKQSLKNSELPVDAVQLIEDTSRDSALGMMKLHKYLDVLIPRGGAELIQSVVENSTVPVIETGVGNCHVYVDEKADQEMALAVVVNAKTNRPGVCNAAESLLIHESIANEFLPKIGKAFVEKNVEIRGDDTVIRLLPNAIKANEEDWGREYLDMIISVKLVKSLDEAISHINQYGTRHSEAIITNDYSNAQKFLDEIDAAAVYVNASTRFTDGYEFGFGAEVGISTQKLHARGPMGLKELTTIKYVIYGNGQIRS